MRLRSWSKIAVLVLGAMLPVPRALADAPAVGQITLMYRCCDCNEGCAIIHAPSSPLREGMRARIVAGYR
jgi:hypothetical protein